MSLSTLPPDVKDAVGMYMKPFWDCCKDKHPAFDMERIQRGWDSMVCWIKSCDEVTRERLSALEQSNPEVQGPRGPLQQLVGQLPEKDA